MNFWSYLLERPLVEYLGPPGRRAARHFYQHDFSVALLTAAAFHLAVMLTAFMLRSITGENGKPAEPEGPGKIFEFENFHWNPAPKVPELPKVAPPRPPKVPLDGIFMPVSEMIQPDTTRNFDPNQVDIVTDLVDVDDGRGGEGSGKGTSDGSMGGGGRGGYGGGDGDGAYPAPDSFVVVEIEPKLVAMEAPDYPELAKMARIEGSVLVRVLVAKDGRVKNVVLLKGAHPLLDQAALAASRQAIFKPAIQHHEPVAAWVNIPFRFSLHDRMHR